jgi:peroxiredoxin
MSRARIAALVALVVLVPIALLAVIVTRDNSSSDGATMPVMPMGAAVAGKADVGSPAPDFELAKLSGGARVRLSQLRGTPVIVTFYASWCHDCEEALPVLDNAAHDHDGELHVVGVSYRDLHGDARSFQQRLKISFPMLFDEDDDVAAAYGVRAIPQTFFIDANGVIRDRIFGVEKKSQVDQRVAELG